MTNLPKSGRTLLDPRPTKDRLADDLRAAGLPEMAEAAVSGYYDDFDSPLAMPCVQLLRDLAAAGTPAALAVRRRAMNGDFDATAEEAERWAASAEGQERFTKIVDGAARAGMGRRR